MSNEFNNLYEFEDFVLNVSERSLHQNEKLIPLAPKVFDTLCILVERHGEVVSKQEMLDTVWKDSFVEENNLSQNISALRKIFGKENKFIETIPRKGFRFVKPVISSSIEKHESSQTAGNGYLVATQTQTHIIEETIQDTDLQSPSPTKTGSPKAPSRNLVFGVAVIFLLASAIGLALYGFFSNRDSKPKTPYASFDYKELTDTGRISSSAISPDGKFVAFVKNSADRRESKTSFHLMELESRNDVEIKIEGDIKPGVIKFAPDGKSIFFRTSGKPNQYEKIYRISILGGEPELIAEEIWGSFSVLPGGKEIAYFKRDRSGFGQNIIVRDLETGEEKKKFEVPKQTNAFPNGAPVFSPDEKIIAYIPNKFAAQRAKIGFIDAVSKSKTEIETNFQSIRDVIWNFDGKSLYINGRVNGGQYQIWNLSYPAGDLTRVTSDSSAYRSLNTSSDGKISVNRLNIHSNLWYIPNAEIKLAKQLTDGQNELGGLLTAQFMPNGEIVYNSRLKNNTRMRVINPQSGKSRLLMEQIIDNTHNFSFSVSRKLIFFEYENEIWKANFDGSNANKVELGTASKFDQPTVSHDEKWLYFVKRSKNQASIWRKPLDEGKPELVKETQGFSPDTFLTASPDGKYLAFVYVTPKKVSDDKSDSGNIRKYGFLNLETKEVKTLEVPAYRSILRWTDGGKSFDFPSFTKTGSAILRKSVDGESESEKVFELEKELIYRFDWSPDGKDLMIGRGDYKMDIVILNSTDSES